MLVGAFLSHGQENSTGHGNAAAFSEPRHFVTNVAQFRTLSGNDYLDPCAFRLSGVVTLVDTNRNLLVLQDPTGAVAVNFDLRDRALRVGQLVALAGTNCHPYVVGFPAYPYRPSGRDLRETFEAPRNWGDYHLTRIRGYLHPPATGEYTFWIASDNSSELWLSVNENPSGVRKIASIPRYGWVDPGEWSRYPSQRSEAIFLKAGEAYYIEAFQEQSTVADHLAVAWQGPAVAQSVIDNPYLTPWNAPRERKPSAGIHGILREYWTNYTAGDLSILSGPQSFESALSVEKVQVDILGPGQLPKPRPMPLNQRLGAEENYRWVEAEGRVRFAGTEGDIALLELSDGQAQVQVFAFDLDPALLRTIRNLRIRVQGVGEGVYDQNGTLVPGLIWATAKDAISVTESARTNLDSIAANQARNTALTTTNTSKPGFYGTRGVVTFNDRVLGKDYLFVQEDTAAVLLVAPTSRTLKTDFRTGQWIELGGFLKSARYLAVLDPLIVKELGWGSIPMPVTEPVQIPVPGSRDGKWSEVEGVARSVNANGTISIMGEKGPVCLWLGQTASNSLTRYVDAKLRARGVLSLTILDSPLLLVPSERFVDVEEEAPGDPFGIPVRPIADVIPDNSDPSSIHRVRLAGEVTYRDSKSFVIQDESGGVRVQPLGNQALNVGDGAQVIGFPETSGPGRLLADALVRPAKIPRRVKARNLDPADSLSYSQLGTLVHVTAELLSLKTAGTGRVLVLQETQRILTATLPAGLGELPFMAPGSRLELTGVCEKELMVPAGNGRLALEKTPTGSLNILLRSAADVVVLRGPPWWTWKRTVALVIALLLIVMVTSIWVHLLRRRLERQHALQFAFSQQILKSLENERQRIAVNLHDSLGQILLAIKNQALLAMQRPAEETGLQQRLNEISGATSQALEEVRQITHGLRPYQLDRLGLTQAIRAMMDRAAASVSISFASRVDDIDNVFDKDSEIHVYRIVQEAVNNVIKHSGASEAAVVVKKRENLVSLSIRDNGRGFDAGSVVSGQPHDIGYGLSGMGERVRILRGSLAIESRPGDGASVTVEVPLPRSNP